MPVARKFQHARWGYGNAIFVVLDFARNSDLHADLHWVTLYRKTDLRLDSHRDAPYWTSCLLTPAKSDMIIAEKVLSRRPGSVRWSEVHPGVSSRRQRGQDAHDGAGIPQ